MDIKILSLALEANFKPWQVKPLLAIIEEFDHKTINNTPQNIISHMLLGIYERPTLAQQVLDLGVVYYRLQPTDEVTVYRITGYNDFTQQFKYDYDTFEYETRYYDSQEELEADQNGTGGTTTYRYGLMPKKWKTSTPTVSRSHFALDDLLDTYCKDRYSLVDPTPKPEVVLCALPGCGRLLPADAPAQYCSSNCQDRSLEDEPSITLL